MPDLDWQKIDWEKIAAITAVILFIFSVVIGAFKVLCWLISILNRRRQQEEAREKELRQQEEAREKELRQQEEAREKELSQQEEAREKELRQIVTKIENKTTILPLQVRIRLGETLGKAGDPRFEFYEEDGKTLVNDPARQRRIWCKEKPGLVVSPTVDMPAIGSFMRGTTPEDLACYEKFTWFDKNLAERSGELHAHAVALSAFEISRYPVTYREYEQYVEEGGETPAYWQDPRFHKPNHPVVGVTWQEACDFCAWLSEKLHKKCRLPTEAEWEYAARGSKRRLWAWGETELNEENAPRLVNSRIGSEGADGTTPVGIYALGATPEQVYDLLGNVWEWCQDVYSDQFYQKCKETWKMNNKPVKDPLNNEEVDTRLRSVRGGSWNGIDPLDFRPALRNGGDELDWILNQGFRVIFPPDS